MLLLKDEKKQKELFLHWVFNYFYFIFKQQLCESADGFGKLQVALGEWVLWAACRWREGAVGPCVLPAPKITPCHWDVMLLDVPVCHLHPQSCSRTFGTCQKIPQPLFFHRASSCN